MNTKNSTSFLFKILAVVLAAASCNAIQMVTGEKTKLGNFERFGDGPQPYYVFFDAGSPETYPYYLNTDHGYIGSLSGAAWYPKNYTYFKGQVYFQGSDGTYDELYSFNLNNSTGTKLTTYSGMGDLPSTVHNDTLYYIANAGSLCSISDPADGAGTCVGANNYHYTKWLRSNPVDNKLYACIGMSNPGQLYTVDLSGAAPVLIDPDGAYAEMPCESGQNFFHYGKFVYAGGASFKIYDSSSNSVSELTGFGSIDPQSLSHKGNLYFQDSGILRKLHIPDGTHTSLGVSPLPTTNILEGPNEIFFFMFDGDSDELFRMPKWDSGAIEQVTDLNLANSPVYLAVGPESFYIIHYDGVEKVWFENDAGNNNADNIFNQPMGVIYEEWHP